MFEKISSRIKSFFILNKSEQRGIIFLIIIIIVLVLIDALLPHFIATPSHNNVKKYSNEINAFINDQDSIADSINIASLNNRTDIDYEIAIKKITPYGNFNPNKLPSSMWKQMGFTDSQIKNIKNYEAKGGKFNTKEDLQKIYTISKIEYSIVEPYIVIPSKYKSKTGKVTRNRNFRHKTNLKKTNINSANNNQLIKHLGLTNWLANRVISYKNILGGYIKKEQLKEVYGLNDSIYGIIKNYIVIDSSSIKKININTVKFKKLLKHPYFDYNTTKSIFNTRDKIGAFTSMDELRLINGVNDSIIELILPYVYFGDADTKNN